MTSREGYDSYQLYLGIKLHFYSEDYDFVKYGGKSKVSRDSVVKHTLYDAASSSLRDQVVPSIVSGVCENPFGPPVTETINLGSSIDRLKFSSPLFDDLHVSSVLWSENAF